MESPNNPQSFAPSKRFLIRGGIAAGLLALILILQTAWFSRLITPRTTTPQQTKEPATLGKLVTKDTNNNGIADWEEKLWGLDPTVIYTNGVSNKQIIEEKKKSLGVTGDTSAENETDLLAKQLFTITTALDQSDSTGALSSVGADLGKSINLKQAINHYSLSDVKTVKTTSASLQAYYDNMSAITTMYKDQTDATDIIVTALETEDYSHIAELPTIGLAYVSFSKKLAAVPTPIGVAESHLALMNGLYGMAESFVYIKELEDNGVNALAGVAIYRTYAGKFNQALTDLSDYFTQYGILE